MEQTKGKSFLSSVLAFLTLVVVGTSAGETRELTLADRVAAQEAIERVYYSHQEGAEKPFELAVPQEVLQRKVVRYLKQSAALEELWHTPVTAETLERELQRMIGRTRMPERLQELFAALDHDPVLIQECLARPTLVDRLVRNFHASDPQLHGAPRREADASSSDYTSWDRWWAETAPGLDIGAVASVASRDSSLALGSRTVPCVEDDTWDNGALLDVPDPRADHTVVWTGTEMIVWGGYVGDNAAWRYDPAIDSWTRSTTVNAPPANTDASAVWMGTEMIVWGGYDEAAGRYDPVSDTWTAISTVDAPSPRYYHTAVWTGTEMIVWGGAGFPEAGTTGGRYDPATDSWTATSIAAAPSPRTYHTAVWTGTRMLVWGGRESFSVSLNTGGRYDPSTDSWTATSIVDAPAPSYKHTAVWTGTEMIVWGGSGSTGGQYDPSTDSWTPTSTEDAPSPSGGHTAVWTGSEMLVWGTDPDYNPTPSPPGTGGRYDPATDSWTAVSTVDAPTVRKDHTAVWTGTEMIVWGGYYEEPFPENYWWPLDTGGRYDPSTDRWTPTSLVNVPAWREDPHTAVWTGTEMIVWGGGTNTGGRYDPSTDSWRTSSPAPNSRSGHSAVWTGSHMVIWGGWYNMNTGGLYDPATDSWSVTTTEGAPSGRDGHVAFWTGSRMLIWGESGAQNSGGLYDPVNDAWTATTTVGAPAFSTGYLAVWTGTQMIVWRASNNTGGRYDPLSDSWTTMSTVGAPVSGASAVWSGSRMIVWHGGTITGGLYDPLSDSWAAISTENAPSPRSWDEAVWAGGRMLIWGGYRSTYPYTLDTGGSYDPVTDSWTSTSTLDAPVPRVRHTIVSTRDQMLVWGGCGDHPDCDSWDLLDSGGRYDPLSDSWTPMSTVDAPAPRIAHTAVWAGSYMLVWGGHASWYTLDSGGRYALGHASDDDGDGLSECDGDCNDGTPLVYPWAPELCDGHDNQCPGEFGHGHVDVGCNSDGDGYCAAEMVTVGMPTSCPHGGGDCNDVNLYVYPGAPEVNDGVDNQCPGDPGHGIVDETSGESGFHSPGDASEYSWPAQTGATLYEVVHSSSADFSEGCTFTTTTETAIATDDPPAGSVEFYLNRPLARFPGSWGRIRRVRAANRNARAVARPSRVSSTRPSYGSRESSARHG